MQRLATGQQCEEVLILHLRPEQQSGALVEYWELLLETVYLSEHKSWDLTSATPVQDAISFNPRYVTWTFTEEGGGDTQFAWDFGGNAPNTTRQE
jgi:type VI protein secretion system component Hcp